MNISSALFHASITEWSQLRCTLVCAVVLLSGQKLMHSPGSNTGKGAGACLIYQIVWFGWCYCSEGTDGAARRCCLCLTPIKSHLTVAEQPKQTTPLQSRA